MGTPKNSLFDALHKQIQQIQAIKGASQTQVGAAEAGIQEQRSQFEAISQMMAPFIEAGAKATAQQQALSGAAGPQAQQEAIQAIERSPMFQSQAEQGEQALLQRAAATGGLRGGNIQEALGQFRPQMLSQAIQQQYSQLGGLSGAGLGAAGQVGAFGQGTSAGIANLLQQKGAIQAGAILAPIQMMQQQQAQQQAQQQQDTSNILGLLSAASGFFSDIRLKENIKKVGDFDGLNVYSWDWNDEAKELGIEGPTIGFMAQEVQETYPDHVIETDSGYLAIDYQAILKG